MKIQQKNTIIALLAVLVFVIGFAMFINVAKADTTIEVAWGYNVEDEPLITKFRIYDKDNLVVVDSITPSTRAAQFTTEDVCNAWHLQAIAGEGEYEIPSDRSNSAPWCPTPPEIPPTPTPSTFTITAEIVVTPN